MNSNEYLQEVKRTCAASFHADKVPVDVLHGAVGAATEAGELLDAVKKSLFYGKTFDRVNAKEEVGDMLWYMGVICNELGFTLEEAMQTNVDKLRARYPGQFTESAALNRDLDAERKILEGAA